MRRRRRHIRDIVAITEEATRVAAATGQSLESVIFAMMTLLRGYPAPPTFMSWVRYRWKRAWSR